jgi:hypothetical protein
MRAVTHILAVAVATTMSSMSALGSQSAGTDGPTIHMGPTCAQLAHNLAGNKAIKSVSSSIVPPSESNTTYCKVNLRYGTTPNQDINIVIKLPLSAADGGSGGVQGAWNGRTQGQGGGGCTGNIFQAPPPYDGSSEVKAGYVVSGNDLGHSGDDCEPGVNADGTYNMQFIQDLIRNGIKQQVLWSKAIAKTYYGVRAKYNYWNGCSTGGRQGYLLAQELGGDLDGVMANAPAMYLTRFQTAQMWGQIAMRQIAGGPISAAKLEQVRVAAIAACDRDDGVTDGIIDDPRTCHFSARANVCGIPTAPTENCLTSAEANAVDQIWDGPRNARHNRIWFPLDRGTDFSALDGVPPFVLGVIQFHWDEHNRGFDWQSVPLARYPDVAQDASRNIADITDTAAPLDKFEAHGGKLLTFVGMNDQAIYPRGVINYYRQMASRYSGSGKPDFARLQNFYRLFLAPGVAHCGGGEGPAPVDPFNALVNWVEHGVVPESLLASGGSAAPPSGRTRPLCPYPQRAIYKGSGSTDDAKNFHCGGNLENRSVVCDDVLTTYKHEKGGTLDFNGTGLGVSDCPASRPAKSEQ